MIRLFIAIPVAEDIKQKISDLVAELQDLYGLGRTIRGIGQGLPKDIRFVPRANWHFTLTFLGYQEESVIPIIKNVIAITMTSEVIGYQIQFERLAYGPPESTPRMIWLTATRETSEKLGKIKKFLEDELESKGLRWRRELRPYKAHLTLARFKETPLKNLPKIEKELGWSYEAKEIHLMKSVLKRTGAEYEIL